jgi:glyoxylase-like metal-dependent hydrolase (beta-lactamase superfamily II)
MPRIQRALPWVLLIGGVASVSRLDRVLAEGALQTQPNIVQMLTLNPLDVLYVFLGGGGNALALVRSEEIVLVDAKLPGWGRSILETVQAVSDKSITTMILTHAHNDHMGGIAEFPNLTQIIAHDNTKALMQKMPAFAGSNARLLPNRTVTDKLSLFDGSDRMDLYYFGAGHTSGDLIVVWPTKRVAYLGDLFPSKAAPVIDTANGGSGVAFPQTLARIVSEVKGVARVVTGHEQGVGRERRRNAVSVDVSTPQAMTWNDLQEYADFNRDFLSAVQSSITAGKTAEEAAATLRLPDRYKAYDMQEAKANVEAIYKEVKGR